MPSLTVYVEDLDTAFLTFLETCHAFNEVVKAEKLSKDDASVIVSGMNQDAYELNGHEIYETAMSKYRGSGVGSGSTSNSSQNSNQHKLVNLKKKEAPKFSGNHKDWPEFKALFQKLIVPHFDKVVLASELKDACRNGTAYREIDHISAGDDDAFDTMWASLSSTYDNVSLSVFSALEELKSLNRVKKDDNYAERVELIHSIVSIYNQLNYLKQTNMVTSREVTKISVLFPPTMREKWTEKYSALSEQEQLHPFDKLYEFIKSEQKTAKLMADTYLAVSVSDQSQGRQGSHTKVTTHAIFADQTTDGCVLHPNTKYAHKLGDCHAFKKLSAEKRRDLLYDSGKCLRCLKDYHGSLKNGDNSCGQCEICGGFNHNTLLCFKQNQSDNNDRLKSRQSDNPSIRSQKGNKGGKNKSSNTDSRPKPAGGTEGASNFNANVRNSSLKKGFSGLYSIYGVNAVAGGQAIVFCDDGSDVSFITEKAAKRLKAIKLRPVNLSMVTLANAEKRIKSNLYEIALCTRDGEKVRILAYSLPELGQVIQLNEAALSEIFPTFKISLLKRPTGPVDILLGADWFSLHPKNEIAKAGNLSIMTGSLGVCVQGAHPKLSEETDRIDISGYHIISSNQCNARSFDTYERHPALNPAVVSSNGSAAGIKCTPYASQTCAEIEKFISGEELGTCIQPKCGACRCGKCPIPGHTYSFKEEEELSLIKENLSYDPEKRVWIAKYPWLIQPKLLPNNYAAAYATLCSTEKKLKQDPSWAKTYHQQIVEHEQRGVARLLSEEEMLEWRGPIFYLSHMALKQPKSATTPVRLVFNSSQTYRGVSLNSCLAKGPDAFNNTLIGMLLKFRESPVVMIGDIRKMYNSVHLAPEDQHCHRFLWRNCEERKPDTWVITRVNLGDRPAGTIAIVAKNETAKMFKEINEEAAEIIINQCYTDDIINSGPTFEGCLSLSTDIEKILEKGGFSVKGWVFGGPGVPERMTAQDKNEVLGMTYSAAQDTLHFPTKLNFSAKKQKVFTEPDLSPDDIPGKIPLNLTRRIVLQQVMGVYDPLGFLSPFILEAKLFLRETWELKLGWDEPLPQSMWDRWVQWFTKLVTAGELQFDRCLSPSEPSEVPELIITSDGSELAYGAAAYVRYKLESGAYWTRLIMAKCRIAPINRVSIPQMELNGAVLSKRLRKVIETEMRIPFKSVTHLIDSRTVLYQIHKRSTRFNVYEGVRIGEIQGATDTDEWAWIPTADNIADWVTKPRSPDCLGPGSAWWDGPQFLKESKEKWGAVKKAEKELKEFKLPGEKTIKVHTARGEEDKGVCYTRTSNVVTLVGAWALVFEIAKKKSFKVSGYSPSSYKRGENLLIAEAQSTSLDEVKTRFKTVNPIVQNGLWVVGVRMGPHNPITQDGQPQILLPPRHPLTKLYMRHYHERRHAGRDATLAAFRARFYTSHGSHLARGIVGNCTLCRKVAGKLQSQMMGKLPPERLKPAPPFNVTMVDLFGPLQVRGEVQKRTTGKAWGVIFVDLCSRALHIEAMFDYGTQSFLLALSRFVAIRGWPEKIYSDPGSQLKGASEDLKKAYASIDHGELQAIGASKGLEWVFGPADSPWYQGAAEALIKSTKRALRLSIGSSRISVPELLTVFTEVAALLNERPIGIMPGLDAELNILTPNLLLLGRSSTVNPGGFEEPNLNSRVTIIRNIVDLFWRNWTAIYAPTLVKQSKWLSEERGVKEGDIVLVADSNVIRGEYRLAIVSKTTASRDGVPRRVLIKYKNFKVGESLRQYKGAPYTTVERSVQRLSLLIPVEDQDQ